MKKVVIFSPYMVSGGPESLHQLCDHLNNKGITAYIFYYTLNITAGTNANFKKTIAAFQSPEKEPPVAFKKYNIHIFPAERLASLFDDDYVIILPESLDPNLYEVFENQLKGIWWLGSWYHPATFNTEVKRKFEHFCNSYELKKRLSGLTPYKEVYSLESYINRQFIHSEKDLLEQKRENRVLFNIAKGVDEVDSIINLFSEKLGEISFHPLMNIDRKRLIELGLTSKVYIDFGPHPGKERMPREMASCGCFVITNLECTAGNEFDVPIQSKFDFKESNFDLIKNEIQNALDNYGSVISNQLSYREKLRKEKINFEEEADNLIQVFNLKSDK